MTSGSRRRLVFAALLTSGAVRAMLAQDAVTVSGHVQASTRPLQGAVVRVPELGISANTDVDGRYSFIIPSSRVRGQTVVITARHQRSKTVSDTIRLLGGSLVKDFDLSAESQAVRSDPSRPSSPSDSSSNTVGRSPPSDRVADSAAFESVAGSTDFTSAIAGRLTGVRVTSASSPGGSSSYIRRGQRTAAGIGSPLVVVDGIPLDNAAYGDVGQRFGFGGFDYGSSIDDLNPWDIRSVNVLGSGQATALFGGRAANGVLAVTTKDGSGQNGFGSTFSQGITSGSPTRFPTLQNIYGQGSAGQFAFFNGTGGGVNDAIAESWGPKLNGQPVVQASLTEARRPDVRYWLPRADNLSSYFAAGRTLATDASISDGSPSGSYRLSLRSRSTDGATPGSALTRRGATFTGQRDLARKFRVAGHAELLRESAASRAGTGLDEGNPLASLVTTPRQVDVGALRQHLRDKSDAQINWIYTDRNNPYFSALENSNEDSRDHIIAGGTVGYAPTSRLEITGRLALDSYSESHSFTIATGWLGGFQTARGRLPFQGGGYQTQDVGAGTRNAELAFTTTGYRAGGVDLSLNGGLGFRVDHGRVSTVAYDTAALGADTARQNSALRPTVDGSTSHTVALFGAATARIGESASLVAGLRREHSDVFASGHDSHIYPFIIAEMNVNQAVPALVGHLGLNDLRIHGTVSRAGADFSRYQIRSVYSGAQSPDGHALDTSSAVLRGSKLDPEITTAVEAGADMHFAARRFGLAINAYHEFTDGLILSQATAAPLDFVAINGASLSNVGIETQLSATMMRSDQFEWSSMTTYTVNRNRVESIYGNRSSASLTPTRWGATLEARRGEALAVIVGSTFLRDSATGDLILKGGLPIADTTVATGLRSLGTSQPKWFGSISNTVRYRRLELTVLFDGQFGGHVFSATNMMGAVSGNLDETAFRPDSGLVISGRDTSTGVANTMHVSTEQYYHALAAIAERWVYSSSFVKLRDVRLSASIGLPPVSIFLAPTLRVSVIGRNLALWSKAPNIDPESVVSRSGVQGFELGQLPMTRSLGLQLSITP